MSRTLPVPPPSRSRRDRLGFRTSSHLSRARGSRARVNLTGIPEVGPPAPPLTQRLLLTPEDAAERLSVGRGRIYALFRTKELSSVQIGRSRRILVSALEAYVQRLEERAREGDAVGSPDE